MPKRLTLLVGLVILLAPAMLGANLVIGLALHAWDRVAGYVAFIAAAVVQAAFFAAIAIAIA